MESIRPDNGRHGARRVSLANSEPSAGCLPVTSMQPSSRSWLNGATARFLWISYFLADEEVRLLLPTPWGYEPRQAGNRLDPPRLYRPSRKEIPWNLDIN